MDERELTLQRQLTSRIGEFAVTHESFMSLVERRLREEGSSFQLVANIKTDEKGWYDLQETDLTGRMVDERRILIVAPRERPLQYNVSKPATYQEQLIEKARLLRDELGLPKDSFTIEVPSRPRMDRKGIIIPAICGFDLLRFQDGSGGKVEKPKKSSVNTEKHKPNSSVMRRLKRQEERYREDLFVAHGYYVGRALNIMIFPTLRDARIAVEQYRETEGNVYWINPREWGTQNNNTI